MPPENAVYYSIPDCDPDQHFQLAPPVAYDITNPAERSWLAELCAENFHYHHDGWESTWPLVVVLHATKDGPVLERFEVEREMVPSFSARRLPAGGA